MTPSFAVARGRAAPRGAAAVIAALLVVALVTWIVTVERMRGMDAGPGTDLGGLGWFLGVWVTMMAAMMLPSAVPMVRVVHRVSGERPGRAAAPPAMATGAFLAGYLAAWTAFGLAAYGVVRGVEALDPAFLAWEREGPLVVGGAVAAAGLYQLTPLKHACLRRCRTPLHWVMHRWREGRAGALAMGAEHGAWCIGCCWGLMLVLLALGAMSLVWMAVVTVLILAEKVLPRGEWLAAPIAAALIVLGAWVWVAPATVPGLTSPVSAADMPGMARPAGGMAPWAAPAPPRPGPSAARDAEGEGPAAPSRAGGRHRRPAGGPLVGAGAQVEGLDLSDWRVHRGPPPPCGCLGGGDAWAAPPIPAPSRPRGRCPAAASSSGHEGAPYRGRARRGRAARSGGAAGRLRRDDGPAGRPSAEGGGRG